MTRPIAQTASFAAEQRVLSPSIDVASRLRLTIVDLNNFASFPTLAIGLLVAALRERGHCVDVLCPLDHDVPASFRERRETLIDHVRRRLHLSELPSFLAIRDAMRRLEGLRVERPHPVVTREIGRILERPCDAILVSAYLQHFNSVAEIGRMAREKGVRLIVGGPMFNLAEVADTWRQIPGLSAIVGAEMDRDLPDLIEAVCHKGEALAFPGVVLADGRRSTPARPLRPLDDTPIPDFSDFPWKRYPNRIVPIMTGRGCQWDRCLFCSDVVSVSGRTFRTRSVESVLREMKTQAHRHDTRNFLFLDLKLNSWPDMLRGIAKGLHDHVPGAEWIGTVHVDERKDNGLQRADLDAAVAGGMRRVSFGLESGSQRLLDAMHKGSSVARNSQFIRDAHAAGLSIRCTMFSGFPGETVEDMQATADFLEKHADMLDRIRFNAFTIHTGTPIWQAVTGKASTDHGLSVTRIDPKRARVDYRHAERRTRDYRKAKARALDIVFAVNRRPLRDTARQFDGLM